MDEDMDLLTQSYEMDDTEFLSTDWGFDAEESVEATDIQDATSSEVVPDGVEDTEEDEAIEEVADDLKKLIGVPIKTAQGDITLNSIDEVLRMVQMGANANSMTQHRKTIQMLENNSLLDNDKLNLMIDVMSGNPEAIRKLMLDKQVSIDAIDSDTELKYNPNNHSVSDTEIEFNDIAKELNSTTEGKTVLDVIANQWDEQSRRAVLEQPAHLLTLVEHMKDGTYTKVTSEVTRRKILGLLPASMGAIQAYAEVGRELFGNGQAIKATQETVPAKTSTNQEGRKRAQKARKTGTSRTNKSSEELAQLSDEDFLKQFNM